MDIALLFGGAVVTVLVQVIKKYVGTSRYATLGTVLGLSLVAAAGAFYLDVAGIWDSFLQIIISAGGIYAFIIKNIEDEM